MERREEIRRWKEEERPLCEDMWRGSSEFHNQVKKEVKGEDKVK